MSKVFDEKDRVTSLPDELKGKTPEEIAAFYQNRERTIATRAFEEGKKAAPPPPPPEHKIEVPNEPTSQDFWNDPVGATKKIAASLNKDSVSAQEFRGVTAAALPSLEQAARMTLRDKYKDARVPFAELESEVDNFITQSGVSPEARINPGIWEAAYDAVKGKKLDSYIQTAETRAKAPPAERVTPQGGPEAKPRELSAEENKVIKGLGRDPARYRKAAEAMEQGGSLPYTIDNR